MSRGLLAPVLVVGSFACVRTGPGPTAPGSAEPTAASGSAITPGRSELDVLPPWMRALFDPGLRRTHAWTYAVDVHDEQGSVAEADGTLRCRSDGPTHCDLGDGKVALVSCQRCEFEPGRGGDEGFEPDLDECFLATADGLWIVDAPPSDDDARRLVATRPYLPASPKPRSESHAREEDGFAHEESLDVAERAITVMGRPTTAWCRTDASTLTYGSSTTRCFAPGLGLVSLEMLGRSGPSTERYPLVEIDLRPER